MADQLPLRKNWVSRLAITGGIAIFILFIAIRIIHAFYIPESYFPLYPAIDTVYADGYVETKFDRIHEGMAKDEVLQLIGEPFSENSTQHMGGACFGFRFPETTREVWGYTGDGACWFADFAWLGRWVYFDQDGKVTAKNKAVHYN